MKNKIIICILVVILIISTIVIFKILFNSNKEETMSSGNIQEIRLLVKEASIEKQYIFKEKDNIEKALKLEEYLKNYKPNNMTNTAFRDIKYEIVDTNGEVAIKEYKRIKPDTELFYELLESLEARKQKIYICNADISEIDKITLSSHMAKDVSIEIDDKELIDKLIVSLQEYYLSDKILQDNLFYNAMSVGVKLENNGEEYTIYSDNIKGIEILKEAGLYEKLAVMPEDVEKIEIIKINNRKEIKDKELMKIVLEQSYEGLSGGREFYIVCTLKASDDKKIYASFLNEKVPAEIEALFK